jgi:hypothetical protein
MSKELVSISAAKLAANRANAQKCTRPWILAGKFRSSQIDQLIRLLLALQKNCRQHQLQRRIERSHRYDLSYLSPASRKAQKEPPVPSVHPCKLLITKEN